MGSLVKPALGASLVSHWRVDAGAEALPATDALGARVHDVRRYGARGDGSTLDTAAVQAAIDACAAEQGGIVLIPAGDFLVGTLFPAPPPRRLLPRPEPARAGRVTRPQPPGPDGARAPLTKGKIQIQSEGAEVCYRNIAVRRISEFPKAYAP